MGPVARRGRPSHRGETVAALPPRGYGVGVVPRLAGPAATGGCPRPNHLRLLRHPQSRATADHPYPPGADRFGCARGTDHHDGRRSGRHRPRSAAQPRCPARTRTRRTPCRPTPASSGSRSPSSMRPPQSGSNTGPPISDTCATSWAPPLPRSATSSRPRGPWQLHQRPCLRHRQPLPHAGHNHNPPAPLRPTNVRRRGITRPRIGRSATNPMRFRRLRPVHGGCCTPWLPITQCGSPGRS